MQKIETSQKNCSDKLFFISCRMFAYELSISFTLSVLLLFQLLCIRPSLMLMCLVPPFYYVFCTTVCALIMLSILFFYEYPLSSMDDFPWTHLCVLFAIPLVPTLIFLFLNNYFDLCQGTFTSSSVSDWIKPEKHQTLAECDKDIHIEGCFLFVQVCYVISKLWCFNKMQFVFFRPIFIYMLPENAYANLLNPKWYPLRYVLHCKHTLFR